jgi:hypothetical protein
VTAPFSPRAEVELMGARAVATVNTLAAGQPWTPATLRAASDALADKAPRLAKRLHTLAAIWSVNFKTVRDAS